MKAVLAVLAGIVVGSMVNMGLIVVGGELIPPPEGVDPTDMESLEANMHRFEVHHFISPLVAHGLGTLLGAAVAALLAPTHKMRFALVIGAFYLLGGIASAIMLPVPAWFVVTDLVLCYGPTAWIGGKLVARKDGST